MPNRIVSTEEDFLLDVLKDYDYKSNAMNYLSKNASVDDIFSRDEIVEYVKSQCDPTEVFDDNMLSDWAESHGYVKQDQTA